MEEDSTPVVGAEDDGLDLSGEDSQDTSTEDAADSGDDDSSSDDTTDDNAPSDADDKSGDDDTSKESKSSDKAPAFDKDLDTWMEERGYGKPENDRERRIAQDARNSQRDFSKRSEANAAAKKLADNITKTAKEEVGDDLDPLAKDVANLKQELMTERQNRHLTEFVVGQIERGDPITEAETDAMGKLLAETAEKQGKAGVDFLTGDMDAWLYLARRNLGSDKADPNAISEKAKQEERNRIAKEQKAAGPNRSAKTQTPVKQESELEQIWKDDSI